MNNPLTLVYVIIALLEITAEFFEGASLLTGGEAYIDFHTLILITKPLLMPALVAVFLFSSEKNYPLKKIIIAALFFAWVGDVTLMLIYINQNFFFAGLGAFLITHVLYINCYIKMMGKNEGFLKRFPLYASPLLLYFVALMFLVFPKLQGVLRFPVAVYSITILLMVLCAMNLFSLVSKKIFFNIFSGALLFMISDSLIALDKFVSPIAFAGVFIMAFYVGGQYLIIKGFALHSKSA